MDGFLNVLKPRGVTSHDVVMLARKLLREERVGHLGTLDPLAVGVLPLACGTYRRLSEYFLGEDKRYFAEFTFGVRTDTGDMDGQVLEEKDASRLDPRKAEGLLGGMTGRILQTPPAYSALKVKGKKLLDLARRGIEVAPEPREVIVHEFRLSGWIPGPHPRGLFFLRVGRGTYVRSLAVSLGEELTYGAAVSYLLRSSSGKFLLRDSLATPALRRLAREGRATEALSDPASVMPDYPAFSLPVPSVAKVSHGVNLGAEDLFDQANPLETSLLTEGPFPFRAALYMPESAPAGSTQASLGRRREVAAVVTVEGPRTITYDKVLISE